MPSRSRRSARGSDGPRSCGFRGGNSNLNEDTIFGGAGNDTLNGGTGNDAFQFESAFSSIDNVDAIQDYTVADDLIQIDAAVFSDGGLSFGTLTRARFDIGAAASDASDRIIYNSMTATRSTMTTASDESSMPVAFARRSFGPFLVDRAWLVTASEIHETIQPWRGMNTKSDSS